MAAKIVRSLLIKLGLLLSVAPVYAQQQETFTERALAIITTEAGLQVINFLVTFAVSFGVILLLAEEIFRKRDQETMFNQVSIILASGTALASSVYATINGISAVNLLGAYGLIVSLALLALTIAQLIKPAKGSPACNTLAYLGFLLLMIGAATPSLVPPLAGLGGLAITASLILLGLALYFCLRKPAEEREKEEEKKEEEKKEEEKVEEEKEEEEKPPEAKPPEEAPPVTPPQPQIIFEEPEPQIIKVPPAQVIVQTPTGPVISQGDWFYQVPEHLAMPNPLHELKQISKEIVDLTDDISKEIMQEEVITGILNEFEEVSNEIISGGKKVWYLAHLGEVDVLKLWGLEKDIEKFGENIPPTRKPGTEEHFALLKRRYENLKLDKKKWDIERIVQHSQLTEKEVREELHTLKLIDGMTLHELGEQEKGLKHIIKMLSKEIKQIERLNNRLEDLKNQLRKYAVNVGGVHTTAQHHAIRIEQLAGKLIPVVNMVERVNARMSSLVAGEEE